MQPSALATASALQTIRITGLNHPRPCAPLPTLSPAPRDVGPTARGENGWLLLFLDRTFTEYPLPVSLAHGYTFPETRRYAERATAELVNGRRKDEFGGRNLRVRGHAKAPCHAMSGVLARTVRQLPAHRSPFATLASMQEAQRAYSRLPDNRLQSLPREACLGGPW